MLKIAALSKDEAECIARELKPFQPELRRDAPAWTVAVDRDANLPEILSALETCLAENGIGSARVTVDDRTYVMEPTV